MTKYLLLPYFCLLAVSVALSGQTINEKKAGFTEESSEITPEMHKFLLEVNRQLRQAREQLQKLYAQANELYTRHAPHQDYKNLLEKIKETRAQVVNLQNSWRELSVQTGQTESYGLWHQPETTLGQLVIDYGSQDYVYLLTPEIAAMHLSVDSNLLIPRASWGEMLELILNQNGIGIKQLNPYLRQLYTLKDDRSTVKLITNRRKDLQLFPEDTRACFVISPEPADVRRTWLFLEKFVNPNTTTLQQIGRDIFVVGQIADLQDLLKLYDFVAANKGNKEYKVIPITRVDPEEMARILAAIFEQAQQVEMPNKPSSPGGKERDRGPSLPQGPATRLPRHPSPENTELNGLKVIALGHLARALFLVGTKEEIRKAEQIIRQVESQVGEAREKVIYWYTAKHSDPEELAEVLYRIYLLMARTGTGGPQKEEKPPEGQFVPPIPVPTANDIANEILKKEIEMLPSELYQTSYYQQGNYIVNPSPVEPRKTKTPEYNKNRDNFLVDPKTGSIAMVVEADILPKLKELIKKLDVAKRMVQIECLLFERRVKKHNNFGLNLLRIGECATNVNSSCVSWGDPLSLANGILEYFLSKKKTCNLPAYDVAYRFLMTQDDIQINASPSVVAVNQTPATIAVVEETSINTGIFIVDTAKGNTLEKAFTRAQYGITIDITPTIHITGDDIENPDDPNYVTLDTDITFDTIQPGHEQERPDVVRRHITNEVRVPDGQTVILGGLRRKNTGDAKESIPFFGELPCIGKFFSMRELTDHETEMFVFLTPTIISDPLFDFERIKCEEMRRRPGDIPEFLCKLVAARDNEKTRILAGSMRILFGLEPDRCRSPAYWRPSDCSNGSFAEGWVVNTLPCCGEYDGR